MKTKLLVLLGERDASKRAHVAIEKSIGVFRAQVGEELPYRWVSSDAIRAKSPQDSLSEATAIWCTPGSPYTNTLGALAAIEYARTREIPFLGTCGGFQHALMEYARSVLHFAASHQEMEPDASAPLITKLSCSLVGAKAQVFVKAGTLYSDLMGTDVSLEEFNCNYGVAPKFEKMFDGTDLEFVAHDEARQPRVFWHRAHPFFAGSLFQPERTAFFGRIHPLVYALLERT